MTEKEATPKKTKAASKAKKPKSAPTHPKVSDMVDSAIQTLKERGGSSLQAIKKYISSTYKVDADKLAPFIRKYLKSAVANGGLVQTKGKGANGSFRIGGSTATTKSAAKPKKAAAKPKAAATPKKAAKAKKAPAKSKPKKSPVKKAKPAAKKAKKAKTPTKQPAKASPKKRAPPKARK